MAVVVTDPPRPDPQVRDELGGFGVATIHEAQGRSGLVNPAVRPIYSGAHICGAAVTVSVAPGDNWMLHVAVEQCQEGDVLVVAPTSASDAGYFGELLATASAFRGVRGLVIDAGVRDVAELTRMGFPVWSRNVSAQGTVKQTLGSVNVPVVCAGQLVDAGDIIVADDDGVVVVRRSSASSVLEACRQRECRETAARARYAAGELSLDTASMRGRLAELGLRYVTFQDYRAEAGEQ